MIARAARVSGLLAATRNAGASDAELLGRFVAERDGSAFATLVARHGSLVFGVCRRILRDWHTAEDAFQATFLVLARRAASISPPGAVAGWLHGVAYRVAKNAQRTERRRTGRERPTAELPEPAAPDAPDTDLRDALDAELRKLPGKYRELLVACDLEGRDRRSVAAALGIPEGTLSSRLTAARKQLARRLARRGASAAVVAAVALSGPALPACEVPRTVQASAATLGCAAAGTVPAGVASLASEASRTVTRRMLTPAALVVLTACGALSAALAADDAPPTPKHSADPSAATARRAERPKANPKPVPKGPNKLLFIRGAELTVVDPDGANEKALPTGSDKFQPDDAKLSPDGSMLAVIGIDQDIRTKKTAHPLYVRKTGDKDAVAELGVECREFVWSADGTRLACTDLEGGADSPPDATHFVIDVKTKEKTAVKLPSNHIITDWSRDGKHFLTTSVEITEKRITARLHLMNRDGTEHKVLTDKSQIAARGKLSPDGKRVLYIEQRLPPKDKPGRDKSVLTVLDIASGKPTAVGDVPLNANVENYCWGPDGKRIAYVWRELHEGKPEEVNDKETVTTVVVCDPDGKNPKTVATATGKGQWWNTISGLDWR
jgi:RNA polymerase sigma factor (sigma-70 family)